MDSADELFTLAKNMNDASTAMDAIAKLTRVMYDSYIKYGFDESNSLQLAMHMINVQLNIALTREALKGGK